MTSSNRYLASILAAGLLIGSATFNTAHVAQPVAVPKAQNVFNAPANFARQTFQHEVDLTIANDHCRASTELAVPAGKILVVEYVSGLSHFGSGFGSSIVDGEIATFRGGQTVFHHFDFSDSRDGQTSKAGQLLRAYADGFGGMQIIVEREGNQGSQEVRITVTGYLVDAV